MVIEKRFELVNGIITDMQDNERMYGIFELVDLLNEQQDIIEELKTYNLQHFLEWLVINGFVTNESMKDINNVIDCVNEFKKYLTEQYEESYDE